MEKLREFGLETIAEWNRANVPRLAAAFSFFAILSLAPLLVLSVVIASQFVGQGDALAQITAEARRQLGPQAAELVKTLASQTQNVTSITWATGLSLLVTFFSASNLFVQLYEAVNTIWKVQTSGHFVKILAIQRVAAFAATIVFGIAVVGWLVLDSWLQYAQRFDQVGSIFPVISFLAFWLFLTGVFSVTYRALPRQSATWSDTLPGALIAGFASAVSKYLFGLYFGIAGVGSAYGVAGALVVILLFINYSSQIYLFGSVVTFVYTQRRGSQSGTPAAPIAP
jgi:membrane protein